MGLEAVELVMEVEETFGISIPDAEAGRLVTAGALSAFVCNSVPLAETRDACYTSRAYSSVMEVVRRLGHGSSRIPPSHPIGAWLSRSERREFIREIRLSGWRAPNLGSNGLAGGIGFTVTAVPLTIIACFDFQTGTLVLDGQSLVFLIMAVLLGVLSATLCAMAFAWRWPAETFGGLVSLIARQNMAKLRRPDESWTRDEVWHTVRAIVAEVAGVSIDRVRPETNFVKDLSLD